MLEAHSIDFDELIETRLLLEVPLAGLAAQRADDRDLEALEALLEELEASSGDLDRVEEIDARVHRLVADIGGNRLAAAFTDWIVDVLQPRLREMIAPAVVEPVIARAAPRPHPGDRARRPERRRARDARAPRLPRRPGHGALARGRAATRGGLVSEPQPRVIWSPPDDVRDTFEVGRYLGWLERERGLRFDSYEELWQWSVNDLEGFWGSMWDFFEVKSENGYEQVLDSEAMPGTNWFTGSQLNYARHLLGDGDEDDDWVAIVAHSQTRPPFEVTFGELREQVARARAGLERLGVGPGDRVVGYLPNIPETLIAFAATASLGAVWASIAPELGARSAIDRLGHLSPPCCLPWAATASATGTSTGARSWRRSARRCPRCAHVVDVPYGPVSVPDSIGWDELLATPALRSRSRRCRSTTRSACSSHRARPASRRPSSTATAGS